MWCGVSISARFVPVLFVAVCGLIQPIPASAIDGQKAAVSMGAQAAKAYQNGDFARATEIYLNAWRTDPKTPGWLFGAARAAEAAGDREHAESHYKAFLEQPTADADRVAKAKQALTFLADARWREREQEADKQVKAGAAQTAAGTYLDLYRTRSDRHDVLFKAATASQEAGDLDAANAALQQYLERAGAGAPSATEAAARLKVVKAALARKQSPQAAGETAENTEGVPAAQAVQAPILVQADHPQSAGWTVMGIMGVGAAIGLGGLGVYLATLGDIDSYKQAMRHGADGKVFALSYAEADSRVSSIRTRETVAWALGGVGLATVGVGAWLALGSHHSVTLAPPPSGTGIGLAGRF